MNFKKLLAALVKLLGLWKNTFTYTQKSSNYFNYKELDLPNLVQILNQSFYLTTTFYYWWLYQKCLWFLFVFTTPHRLSSNGRDTFHVCHVLLPCLSPRIIVELEQYGVLLCFCQAVEGEINARCYAVDTWKATRNRAFMAQEFSV